MKRTLALLLCAIIALGLSGCGDKKTVGMADNEIVTYNKVDPKKTTLFISTTGNDYISNLNRAFEQANPDVQIETIVMTLGAGTSRPMANQVINGDAPDIMYVAAGAFTPDESEKYFENLSSNAIVQRYQNEALNRIAANGNIYFLPGPSSITCMLYNNTLFEQYGWQVPKTFDEFVALCLKIREDTNGTVQPWNPNAKYETNFNAVTTAFVYEELFGGVENRRWYNEFCAGRETFAGHMEPYYEMIQTLIDNKIILEEHFSYSATTRGNEFKAGQIAMYNYTVGSTQSKEYDIQYMPFPSTKGDKGYLVDNINTTVGVPKKEHTKEEKDAINRYLEYFTSAEGQKVFIGENMMFSNVKDVPLNNAEYLMGIEEAIAQGRYFSQLTFASPSAASNISLTKDAKAMLLGEKTAAECVAANDAQPFKTGAAAALPETIATVAENFTMLETSFYFADMYREKAGADIGLIAHNAQYRGNLIRMYKGPLNADDVKAFKPRSFDNKTTLVKASMTGKQILDALAHIAHFDKAADAIYAFSGLKCKVAPWKPMGEKYLEVALADGKKLDENRLYTVAFWGGTVYDEYITEILETYEGTFEQLLTERLQQDKTIAPAKDGRITLVWN